jgi:hypothetical protein
MAKRAKRKAIKRRPWSAEDVKLMKQMARKRTPTAEIAKLLKRTPGAVAQKAFVLGLSLDTRR